MSLQKRHVEKETRLDWLIQTEINLHLHSLVDTSLIDSLSKSAWIR